MTRLPNIQILRACAAMMIVIYHCGIETSRLAEMHGQNRLFDENPLGSGVPLFFAISGFIMTVTCVSKFGSLSTAIDFMRRRLIRIVPLYWALTTVAACVALVAPNLTKAPPGDYLYYISSYLFCPYMRLTGDVRPLATPGWTLNLEMLFYVIFAAALLFPRRVGLPMMFGSLGLLVAARMDGLLPGVALNFWGDPIVLGFLFGATVGILYVKGVRLSRGLALTLLAIGFALLLQPGQLGGAEDDLLRRLATAIPSVIVLAGFALGPQVDVRRRFWQPALLIGNSSYSLYLVQEFMLRLLFLFWLKAAFNAVLPLWTFIPIGIAVSLGACLTSYRYFEVPVTRWLQGAQNVSELRYDARQLPMTDGTTRPAPVRASAPAS